jgi:hypothetical protein
MTEPGEELTSKLATEEFVRRGGLYGGLLVPADVADAELQAGQAEVLRAELADARHLVVAQQAEHRAVVAELVERATTNRATERVDDLADPAGDVDEPADAVRAARLRAELAAGRDLIAVQAEDAWARRAQATEHRIAMADVAERDAAADRERRERARDAAEADALAALYRRAAASGARARIRAEISGSAEMRALRVAAVRRVALIAGLPVLAAFAAWSTTGVQAGVVRLLHLADASAAWWASWAVEPALITVVALIIVGRAVLRSSGGDTDWKAGLAEWSALGLSLALNIVGGWPGGGFWAGTATALPHAIGPLGCAGTAFLIGLFDGYVSTARPWDGAPRLADLDLTAPVPGSAAGTGTRALTAVGTGTGARRTAAVRTGTAGTAGTGGPMPARRGGTGGRRTAVAASSSTGTGGRRAISARTGNAGTGTGTGTGASVSAKAAARTFWEAEVAAGRQPTGSDLARAAGRDNDDNGLFRRWLREWTTELASQLDGPGDLQEAAS